MNDAQAAAITGALGAGDALLASPRVTWVRWSIGVLALLVLATLAIESFVPAEVAQLHLLLTKLLTWTHRTLGTVLGVVLVAWLLVSKRAQHQSRARARLWEESIESMKVGVALYVQRRAAHGYCGSTMLN